VSATAERPATVSERLEAIDLDLSELQREIYDAAMEWFKKKRDKEHDWAVSFMTADGTVADRKAAADKINARDGMDEEALYEALRAKERVLETRANIGMALLKAQGRGA
jgi:hypothetical protein